MWQKVTTPAYRQIKHTKDNFLFVHFKKRQSHSAMDNVQTSSWQSGKKKKIQADRQAITHGCRK